MPYPLGHRRIMEPALPEGIEPPTPRVETWRSDPMSYGSIFKVGLVRIELTTSAVSKQRSTN